MDEMAQNSPARLTTYARQHLILYDYLSKTSGNELMYHIYPKHHLFCHVAMDVTSNPMDTWNYRDEDEIGKAVRIAKTVSPPYLHQVVVTRHRWEV